MTDDISVVAKSEVTQGGLFTQVRSSHGGEGMGTPRRCCREGREPQVWKGEGVCGRGAAASVLLQGSVLNILIISSDKQAANM